MGETRQRRGRQAFTQPAAASTGVPAPARPIAAGRWPVRSGSAGSAVFEGRQARAAGMGLAPIPWRQAQRRRREGVRDRSRMAVTAKSARGAAREPGGALRRHAAHIPHRQPPRWRGTASVGKPWHDIMENQRIPKVSRTSAASMAVPADGAKCPLHGAQRKQKMKGKKS